MIDETKEPGMEYGEPHQDLEPETGTRSNLSPEEIDVIVESAKHFSASPERYAEAFYEWELGLDGRSVKLLPEEEQKKELIEREVLPILRNNILIDLGCGDLIGAIPRLARLAGASKYIGVERFHRPYTIGDPQTEYVEEGLDFDVITGKEGDMLRFLSKQPDNSANITINGIDYIIIDLHYEQNRRYSDQLAKEIRRVIGSDHIVFGVDSDAIFDALEAIGGLDKKELGKGGLLERNFAIFRRESETKKI